MRGLPDPQSKGVAFLWIAPNDDLLGVNALRVAPRGFRPEADRVLSSFPAQLPHGRAHPVVVLLVAAPTIDAEDLPDVNRAYLPLRVAERGTECVNPRVFDLALCLHPLCGAPELFRQAYGFPGRFRRGRLGPQLVG